MVSRRGFLASAAAPLATAQTRRPNVVLIITDDQGYGDLSIHGNPHLETPSIDSIGRAGVQFTQFHVNPVCSPTRSSLMTGRYYYRTGVVDTYLGRSMMHADETTLAELLRDAGYRTGIFGKWHLGDNYPLRAIDQGFQEALVHTGGGISQPSDPPGNRYFDPILQHSGKPERHKGYCTDIFLNAAGEFIEKNRSQPFFAYVATNAPHDPLEVDGALVAPYLAKGLDERTAKVYAMVKNIDDNVGRLLERLRKLELERDTIVIFMTDNGPQHDRYNGGIRGRKGTVYEGGIRVPFLLHWPASVKPGSNVDRLAAHIDVMPTLLEACGVRLPGSLKIDGRSLMPLLRGKGDWADRTLYFQWHRGDVPEMYRACAARNQRYKLVDGKELYDLEADPAEKNDIAVAHTGTVARMRAGYEAWFRDMASTRKFAPPRIHLGTPHENPVTLTRQDWRGAKAGWAADSSGHWEVEVASAGDYEVTLRLGAPLAARGRARFRLNGAASEQAVEPGAASVRFARVALTAGAGQLAAEIDVGGGVVGPMYVDVRKL